jgi:hypothetical protein
MKFETSETFGTSSHNRDSCLLLLGMPRTTSPEVEVAAAYQSLRRSAKVNGEPQKRPQIGNSELFEKIRAVSRKLLPRPSLRDDVCQEAWLLAPDYALTNGKSIADRARGVAKPGMALHQVEDAFWWLRATPRC